ncbi:MAG: beta-lactamase family protein [Anaerolineales bacterium]|nr:beta-lactamase family protein [Anaerolineales bacterium]
MKIHPAEELGFSEERLSRIGVKMQKYVDERKIAGSINLVARRGQVAYLEKFGYQDVESKIPMALDTIFRMYSMTKPVTSLAFMMLYEQGEFQLTDPLSKFIPNFADPRVIAPDGGLVPAKREITLHHLLNHTAGFAYGDEEDLVIDMLYRAADVENYERSLDEFVAVLAGLPLMYHPGDRYHYSLATDVLGRVIEIVSDMPLDAYFDKFIFKPLDLEDTSFWVPKENHARFATLYGIKNEDKFAVLDKPDGEYGKPVKMFSGGHGLVSTTLEYFKIAQLFANGGDLDGVRLLGPKTVDLMRMNHLAPGLLPMTFLGESWLGYGFGLGFGVIIDPALAEPRGSLGSYGWGGYANTHFWIDPVEDIIGLLMMQYLPSRTYPVTDDFHTLVYQALIE